VGEFASYEPRTGDESREPRLGAECIRRARPEDAAGIAGLVSARHGMPLERALDGVRREFAGLAAGNPWALFVADVDGGVVGFGRTRKVEASPGVPEGWYLLGMIVHGAYRRRGIGLALTRARLAWIRERSKAAYYFASKENRASIELHAQLGFAELTDDFEFARANFASGDGSLYRVSLH